jgi:hypothetical protein
MRGASIAMLAADGGGPSRISGKVTPAKGHDFGFAGSIDFNGLAIYYAYYADLSVSGDLGDGEDAEGSASKRSAKPKAKLQSVKESKELFKLLEPWQWPKPSMASIQEAL